MIRPSLFALALALLPQAGFACDGVTHYFDICVEGTPWADGRWENGGDSATLYIGKFGYEAYEDFPGHETHRTRKGALTYLLNYIDDSNQRENHLRDTFATPHLKIARSIDTLQSKYRGPLLSVIMIADGGGRRVELSLEAPVDTPLATVDRLSKEYAALIVPTTRKTE